MITLEKEKVTINPDIKVIKRDGRMVVFDSSKIYEAILKASEAITPIIAAPASIEYPHFKYVTKNNIPNKPYTIDGIPESVSAVSLIIPTTLLPFFAYSTRYIAVHIPSGTATISEQSVISIVFIIAGNIDTFSVV